MVDKTPALFKELIGLRGGPLHEYLTKEYAGLIETLVVSNGEFLGIQGEARQLKTLIHMIDTAKESLIKSERIKPDMRKAF